MNSIREFYGETTIDEKDSEELNLGEKIKLEYYKTISKLFINEGKETYGIGIVKKCRNNGKEKFESREINNILVEEKQTEKFKRMVDSETQLYVIETEKEIIGYFAFGKPYHQYEDYQIEFSLL